MAKLMSLGLFVFSIPTLAFNELDRQTDWRHPTNSRVGARPASQFAGPGEDRLTLSGMLLPELIGDPRALSTLREMGDAGEAYPLVNGRGVQIGYFVIEGLDERSDVFTDEGVARKTDFRLSLKRVDDQPQAGA